MSLEHVKSFYEKLANDEAFRNQVQGAETKEECSKIVKASGLNFTVEEYEEYTLQLLESAAGEGELQDLNERELEAVFGGASSLIGIGKPIIQPLYGVIFNPQPLYGVVQPLYGVTQVIE